ncbi:ATPase [Rhodococcus aerolatus]
MIGRKQTPTRAPRQHTTTDTPPTPSGRAAKKAAYSAARAERDSRPTSRGWRRPGGGHVAWVEPGPEYRGTTVQVCGLWPFSAGSGTPTDGVPLGQHQLTGATVCGDPIMWFLAGRILNPSAFVLGRPGLGKSTLVRRIVNVSAAFGVIPLVLADLKPDYPDLIRALDGQVIEVGRGRGHVNPLDPGPLATELHRLPEDTRRRVASEQLGRALNVLTGLCELVRGGPLSDREQSMLTAALRVVYAATTDTGGRPPLISNVVRVIADRHPRVRAMSLDRGEEDRYDNATELLRASLMALGEDGQFGDTFSRHTTTPMLLDRAVVFDVSAIDTAEIKLQAAVQLVCWSYGQSAVSAAKELADAGLRERAVYLMVMDELWRTLKASPEMVDRVDELTRLNRQKVLGQVLITHTMNDLKLDSQAATLKAWGFVERSEMVFLGGLADAEMGNLREVFAMSDAETRLISDWSAEGGFSAEDGRRAVPPGQGKFLLKVGKKPGTPFEVVLTSVEAGVNDTNKGWAQARTRHHGTPTSTPPSSTDTAGDPR